MAHGWGLQKLAAGSELHPRHPKAHFRGLPAPSFGTGVLKLVACLIYYKYICPRQSPGLFCEEVTRLGDSYSLGLGQDSTRFLLELDPSLLSSPPPTLKRFTNK